MALSINLVDELIIALVAASNNISVDNLYSHLKDAGMTRENYRKEIRNQLIIQRLQQQELMPKLTITNDEVDNFIQSALLQFNSSNEYRLEDILISLSDAPSPEEIIRAKKHADLVLAKLKNGENFRQIAQSESGDKRALQGGDLGWRKLPEIPSAFAELVTRMQKKEILGPIQTPNGFHIIRLTDMRATKKQAPPDRKEVQDLLFQRKFEEALQNWISKLRNQAYVVNKLNDKSLA